MGNEIAQSVRVVSDEEREAELASLRDANDKLWRDKCSLIEKLRPLNEAIPPMFDSNGDRLPSLGALHQLIAEREAAVVRVAKLEEQAERVDAAVGATAEKFVNGHNALKARVEKLEKQHVDAEMLRHALAKSEIERLKAIRARDEAAEFWKGELRSRTAERDAAIRERESWKLLADRTNERLSAAEARVAELEAASGGGEGAPVAWMCEWTDHVGLHHTKTDAEDEANGDIVPQPLYRSPPQPRGWLTGEESALVKSWERHYMQGAHYAQSPSHTNDIAAEMGKLAEVCKSILARSTPPKVEIPEILFARLSVEEIGQLTAALAAAGVAVKEGK
jgi:hypothetical protein